MTKANFLKEHEELKKEARLSLYYIKLQINFVSKTHTHTALPSLPKGGHFFSLFTNVS